MPNEGSEKTALGLEPNATAALSYVFGWVSGLIVFLVEKKNPDVRFHALQSIVIFLGLQIIQIVLMVSVVGLLLTPIIGLFAIILWIFLIVKAFQGERYKLPVVGDFVEKQLAKKPTE